MDCLQVRQQISAGREQGRAIVEHLGHCEECQGFRRRLQEADNLLQMALPFEAPSELSRRLLALVPQAARELQVQAARQAEERRAARQQLLRQLFYLLVGAAIFLSITFWPQILNALQSTGIWMREFIPLIPAAIGYWGGRVVNIVLPIWEILWVIACCAVLALLVEYTLRSRRARSAVSRVQHRG